MAKELITRTWCDACSADGAQTEATVEQFVSLLLGGSPYIVDLCGKHFDELVAPLDELAMAAGRPVDLDKARPAKRKYNKRGDGNYDATRGVFVCGVGCGTVTVLRGSMRKHIAKVHGMGLTQYEGIYGEIVDTGDTSLLTISCTDCDERFSALSSLGIHRKKAHATHTHPHK
jgi:hypothetical protein